MAAWTATSIFPKSFLRHALTEPIRRALPATAPASTGNGGVTLRRDSVAPASTGSGLVAPAPVVAPTNQPEFLQSGQNQTTPLQGQDILGLLQDLIGGQRQDPDLVKAQTVLAQQQAMQIARENQAARERESNALSQNDIRNQIRQYQTSPFNYSGKVASLNDQLSALGGTPVSPARRGWTGPAMPGTWGF